MPTRALEPQSLAEIPVVRASALKAAPCGGTWKLRNLTGILAEVSEETPSGTVSFVTEIILEAQGQGDPVAWVAGKESVFFPPDLSDRGVDLSALAVIRAGGEDESLTAVEWLIRSGAMGLVILDAGSAWQPGDASLGRIQKLAERSRCAVVILTRKPADAPSLGSRISLRGCVTKTGRAPFHVDITAVKDKRSSAGSRQGRCYNGPPGMC